ncbi:MAG: type II toxin-antitoxin system RelE/ParE family toxin [Desulfobulbaceae bacterium]|nr:type II toxin-antitoxin system RelE/ParE family toxin [Desulfobulbaceae bacterium]
MKRIEFHGTSLKDIRAFPEDTKGEAGQQLAIVQYGGDPDDWKPMLNIGKGVREIRIRDKSSQFRVIYVAKFRDAVHVLHAFQKKTQKTSKTDIELAKKRYKEIKG